MRILPALLLLFSFPLLAAEKPKAFVDGFSGQGWVTLTEKDFAQVNCDPDTFQFGEEPGMMHCTGNPFGGLRSVKIYKNFEMVWSGDTINIREMQGSLSGAHEKFLILCQEVNYHRG